MVDIKPDISKVKRELEDDSEAERVNKRVKLNDGSKKCVRAWSSIFGVEPDPSKFERYDSIEEGIRAYIGIYNHPSIIEKSKRYPNIEGELINFAERLMPQRTIHNRSIKLDDYDSVEISTDVGALTQIILPDKIKHCVIYLAVHFVLSKNRILLKSTKDNYINFGTIVNNFESSDLNSYTIIFDGVTDEMINGKFEEVMTIVGEMCTKGVILANFSIYQRESTFYEHLLLSLSDNPRLTVADLNISYDYCNNHDKPLIRTTTQLSEIDYLQFEKDIQDATKSIADSLNIRGDLSSRASLTGKHKCLSVKLFDLKYELTKDSEEWKAVKESMGETTIEPLAIEKINNVMLKERYENRKKSMMRERVMANLNVTAEELANIELDPNLSPKEEQLYYVTNLSVERLSDEGIDFRRSRGGFLGQAIYLHVSPDTADFRMAPIVLGKKDGNYTYRAPSAIETIKNLRRIVICDVIVGSVFNYPFNTCDSELIMCPTGFDSTGANIPNYSPGPFKAVYDTAQVLPKYVIWYTNNNNFHNSATNLSDTKSITTNSYNIPSEGRLSFFCHEKCTIDTILTSYNNIKVPSYVNVFNNERIVSKIYVENREMIKLPCHTVDIKDIDEEEIFKGYITCPIEGCGKVLGRENFSSQPTSVLEWKPTTSKSSISKFELKFDVPVSKMGWTHPEPGVQYSGLRGTYSIDEAELVVLLNMHINGDLFTIMEIEGNVKFRWGVYCNVNFNKKSEYEFQLKSYAMGNPISTEKIHKEIKKLIIS